MTLEEFNLKYTDKLNDQQQEAVHAIDGAVLLLAVPGSGKTTVLVTRLGYMVCCANIAPGSILTMTYTVAATEEMKQRFGIMFGKQYADVMEFRTINGISSKIIDYYVRFHGTGQSFPIVENNVAMKIVGQIYQKINDEFPTESTIKDIRTGITYIKNMMLTAEEIDKMDVGIENMPKIYQQYCSELKQQRLMDYDDQMSYALTILKNYPALLDYFQEKFHYICVDESQDTSKIQHAIIKLLAQKYGNIFMVGDEDQSIYGFRAAYPEALMNFSNDYADAKVLLMEKNYRSTNEIIAVANAFVSRNRFRYEKTIQTTRGNGLPIQRIRATDRTAQYKYLFTIAQDCEEETAVLYRNNDSALPLIDLLERNGIAYNCKKFDEAFFSHKIINDITDIINFAYDQHDATAFMRIYYKFGSPITKKAATYACEQSHKSGKTILEELIHSPELGTYAKDAAIDLYTILPEVLKDNAETAIIRIWRSLRYGIYVKDKNLDAGKFDILCMLGRNEPSLQRLLLRLAELRSIIQNHENSQNTKFLLSTVHSSKGLEYNRVYILDIFDGTLPSKNPSEIKELDEVRQYEEDRRLYYVAMTRAKNELHLFDCTDRSSSFTCEVLASMPKEEIDEEDVFAAFKHNLCGKTYTDKVLGKGRIIAHCGEIVLVEYESQKVQLLSVAQMLENRDTIIKYAISTAKPKVLTPTVSAAKAKHIAANIKVGSRIEHKSFGIGTIVAMTNGVADIEFDKSNKAKRLMLSTCLNNGLLKLRL